MNNLKPCPFCGGKPMIRGNGTHDWIDCLECRVSSPIMYDKTPVEKLWNQRIPPAWISVKDRLPEDDRWVLCLVLQNSPIPEVVIGKRYGEYIMYNSQKDITHWMELPDEPEGV